MARRIECVFEYCDFGDGYLRIFFPSKKNIDSKQIMIDLEDYPSENGVISNVQSLVDRITFELKQLNLLIMPSVTLLLRCQGVYRTSISIPAKFEFYANSLYKKEMKDKTDDDKFYAEFNSYKREVGYTYNTYFMPKNIVDAFQEIAKLIGTEIVEVKPFGMYLCDALKHDENYVFFYIRRNVCTMILSSDGHLITSYDFEFESAKDIMNKFLLVASKHEFEFDRQKITHYGISADDPIELSLGLTKLGDVHLPDDSKNAANEQAMDESVRHENDMIEVDWENYDDDKTSFSKRYGDANDLLRKRYDAIAQTLLSYTDMKCKISEQCAIFRIDSQVYARMDIRNSRVQLYLNTDPHKYVNSRYPCALTKRRGFENTPCLYRIATKFRYEGAFEIISDLAAEHGLVPKEGH